MTHEEEEEEEEEEVPRHSVRDFDFKSSPPSGADVPHHPVRSESNVARCKPSGLKEWF